MFCIPVLVSGTFAFLLHLGKLLLLGVSTEIVHFVLFSMFLFTFSVICFFKLIGQRQEEDD